MARLLSEHMGVQHRLRDVRARVLLKQQPLLQPRCSLARLTVNQSSSSSPFPECGCRLTNHSNACAVAPRRARPPAWRTPCFPPQLLEQEGEERDSSQDGGVDNNDGEGSRTPGVGDGASGVQEQH